MFPHFTRRLSALVAACCALTAAAAPAPEAEFLHSTTWSAGQQGHGGFSGLEVWDKGRRFATISDRGTLVTGRFTRSGGRINGISATPPQRLHSVHGQELHDAWADSEGLARRADGRLFISFEGHHRVLGYDSPDRALRVPRSNAMRSIPNGNSGLEALAIDRGGRLYTIPERSGRLTRPFPVWRLAGNRWEQAFELPRDGGFLVVGADFGPDGRFYVLERGFTGFGFRSRVRRFTLEGDRIIRQDTLLETGTGRHDNLEGISVWRDEAGAIRLTMISDDNFRAFQRTEIVEYRVTD